MTALAWMGPILVATTGIGAAGAILAWRERPEPGAVPLAVLLAAQAWWSATLFFRLEAVGYAGKVFWLNVSWVGVPLIPVAWLLFALEYSGRTRYLRPKYVAALSLVPAITILVALTNGYHDFLHVSIDLVELDGRFQLVRTPGPWYWVIAGYTYLLGLLGAIPLIEFITSEDHTFRGQSLALLVGLLVPWVTNALFLVELLPTGNIDPTPVAFSISGIAYLGAVTRFQLFGKSPAPIRPAREAVLDRMREGIVVLDRDDNIVETNEQVSEMLDTDTRPTLEDAIETDLPRVADDAQVSERSGQTVFRPDGSTRAFDVNRSAVRDTHGRTVGHIVTLHDISDLLRQQQRLEVVNRVYRHNIRTDLQVILGYAETIANGGNGEHAETIKAKATEIDDYTTNIRQVLDLFERGRSDRDLVSLRTILLKAVDSIESNYPEVTVHVSVDVEDVAVDELFEDVLWNVVENAAQHNTDPDPQIWVDATETGTGVDVSIADNGPGMNDDELVLLEEGNETPLQHGSGVGFAIVVWGTEMAGGRLSVEDREPEGTIVTITIPTVSRTRDRA